MAVDYKKITQELKGLSVVRPAETLSGYADASPFESCVYDAMKKRYPKTTFRQHEYLNDLFSRNPDVIGHEARHRLANSPIALFLFGTVIGNTDHWASDHPSQEKQNDTADIVVVERQKLYHLVDVKTRNTDKKAQPPNIISAYKLAQMCAIMIDNQDFDCLTMNYIELDWQAKGEQLVCADVHCRSLFKAKPENLYINWAAAMQIQFHVCDLDQDFNGSLQEWAKSYIAHFVAQAKRRADFMIEKFVRPFEKYL